MVGKRPRQMQRTVSVSMMHMRPESILSETPMIPEFPKEMQNPQVDVLACYSQGKSAVSTNNPDTDHTHLFVSNANSEACYAAHVFPFASEANHSRPRPWEIKEGEPEGGLSIVATLEGRDPYTTTFLTDSTYEIPAVYHNSLPHHFWTSLAATTLQQHHEMELQEPFCDHLTTVSGFLKGAAPNVSSEAHFLEVCCYCRHRLSHGRDIYMYRGDKAFCSEECRHQQIVIDERQIKCSLTALKVRTVAQPAHLGAQQSQAIATSATAAG